MRDKLIAMLKLDPAATDDAIMEALETALKAVPAPAPLGVDVAKLVNEAVAPLSVQIVDFKKELDKRDKDSVLMNARIEGKVVALNAEAIGQLSLEALKAHVAALPVTVPLSAQTPAHVAEGAIGTITEEQRAIALACGQDPEKVYGKTK